MAPGPSISYNNEFKGPLHKSADELSAIYIQPAGFTLYRSETHMMSQKQMWRHLKPNF